MNLFKKIFGLLDNQDRLKLLALSAFSILVSLVETVGISSLMPFIEVISDQAKIQNKIYYRYFYDLFNFKSENDFIVVFGIILIVFFLFRGFVNLIFGYLLSSYTQKIYSNLSQKLYTTYLNLPFSDYSRKNTSFMNKALHTEVNSLTILTRQILLMLSEILLVIFIYVVLLLANWKATLSLTFFLLLNVMFLTFTISKRIKKYGHDRAKYQAKIYEIFNKLFGNFKQIKLLDYDRIKDSKIDLDKSLTSYTKCNTMYSFLGEFPRVFMETIGFLAILCTLIFAITISQIELADILPVVTLFAISMYRLLPSINRIMNAVNSILYFRESINIVTDELNQSCEEFGNNEIKFKNKITLKNISVGHDRVHLLSDVNFNLSKGIKVAFIGSSGSGKTSLVDTIVGINKPITGSIFVDDTELNVENIQNWRSQIGYIPQNVYLNDGDVKSNVCFGRVFDQEKLIEALEKANIYEFLKTKQGIHTIVGEGGIQLSGGQKQRIAIARALYGNPEVLVLDEATSSLDSATEKKIMDEIYNISSEKTLIIIAHRLSTIKECDEIYQVKNGLVTLRKHK